MSGTSVWSGQIVSNAVLTRESMWVSSGGSSIDTYLELLAPCFIYNGGVAINTICGSRSYINISSGGYASNTTLIKGGYLNVYGTANKITVSVGSVYIHNGGIASNITLHNAGLLNISNGGKAIGVSCTNSNGRVNVSSGGIVSNVKIDDAMVAVLSGGVISGGIITGINSKREQGDIKIYNGGEGYNLSAATWGDIYAFGSGKLYNTVLNSGGKMFLGYDVESRSPNDPCYYSSGGYSYDAKINNGGLFVIYKTGKASRTIVNSGGSIKVDSGGFAGSTTVNVGGSICILPGGSATVVYNPWQGAITSSAGAKVTYLERDKKVYYGGTATGLVSKGDSLNKIKVANGQSALIFSGGVMNSTTVSSGGRMLISSGGIASNTTLLSGAYSNYAYSGATVKDMIISSGARLFISGTDVNATGLVIKEGGFVDADVHAADVNRNISGRHEIYGDFYVRNGSASGFVVSSGDGFFVTGGTAEKTIINGGSMGINATGIGSNTTVNSGGTLKVNGKANSVTVNSGGLVEVSSGGMLQNAIIEQGHTSDSIVVSEGGSANNVLVKNGGDFRLYGGFASDVILSGGAEKDKSDLFLLQGGSVCNVSADILGVINISSGIAEKVKVLSGGKLVLHSSGAVVKDTTILAGASARAYGGTTLDGLIISSGAQFDIATHNVNASNIYIHNGGTLDVDLDLNSRKISGSHEVYGTFYLNNSVASNFAVGQQDEFKVFGGSALKTTVTSGASMSIRSGALASGTTINSGGSVYISRGGIASNTTMAGRLDVDGIARGVTVLSGGYLNGRADAALSNTTVSSGGRAFLGGGGGTSAYNMIVKSGGSLEVDGVGGGSAQNAQFYGDQTFGGTVNIVRSDCKMDMQGKMITFAIEERKAGDAAIVNNLGYFTNAAYYVRISENQADGEYKLAQGANNFTGSITVGDGTLDYGTLTVNGDDLTYGGNIYSLNQVDGNLTFTIKDITPPIAPVASADIITATNGKVTVSAEFSSDSIVKEYSLNEREWSVYEKGIDFFENGKVYFRGQDAAGNYSDVVEYIVGNIDKEAPTLEITGNAVDWTNKDVTLTASASDGTVEYFANGKWNVGNSLTVTENGTYQFRVTDAAGNSVTDSIVVNNIDKVAPDKPEVYSSITAPTNKNVTVSAEFSLDSVQQQYSLDNQTWNNYEDGIVFNRNGIVYFRGIDAAGNISDVTEYRVSNIDKIAPAAPTASANINTLTNGSVIVTAEFSSDTVRKEFSYDGQTWGAYNAGIEITANGTLYFRGKDAAGNYSEITEYEVTNIDKIAPAKPIVSANITAATNQSVTVIATFSNDTVTKEYSLDNKNWEFYTSSIVFEQNGVVYFRGTDEAGNVSEVTEYKVANIDKVAPVKPVATSNNTNPTNSDVTVEVAFSHDSVIKQYRIGDGEWQDYIGAFAVSENGTVYFRAEDAVGNESSSELVIANIDKTAPAIPGGFNETISGYDAKLDWSDASDTGVAGVKGYYVRYGTSELLTGEGKFITASEFDLTDLAVGTYCYQVKTEDNAGNISEWSAIQSFEITPGAVQNLRGDSNGLSWDAIPGVESYIVEYSTDNFANVMSFETTSNKVDSIALPSGTYQWRVKAENGNFAAGNDIVSAISAIPQQFASDADGDMDIFFATGSDIWGADFFARHTGMLNGWLGTGEEVALEGKKRLADIFEGSADANILVMTDDANGDTLFVDDVYTSFGKDTARISQIDEIRAGAGDDIVDMTSQQFAYTGDGVKICGGLGNDIIWANNGENILFGDAGNDRLTGGSGNDIIIGGSGDDILHGGGGNDLFCFGGSWGCDTVKQLSGGKITLRFESGSVSGWNAETLTYSDGVNSITVRGIASEDVTLVFAGDTSGLPAGAFADCVSESIFEDQNKGMLA